MQADFLAFQKEVQVARDLRTPADKVLRTAMMRTMSTRAQKDIDTMSSLRFLKTPVIGAKHDSAGEPKPYLSVAPAFASATLFKARLRALPVHRNLQKQDNTIFEGVCTICRDNATEGETHFVLLCVALKDERSALFSALGKRGREIINALDRTTG
eukprot:Opistho-2@95849